MLLDPTAWLTREVLTIFLVVIFVFPAHTISEWVWRSLMQKRFLWDKLGRIELFQLNMLLLLVHVVCFLTYGMWFIFNT